MVKRVYVCTRSLAENLKENRLSKPPIVVRVDNGPEHYGVAVEIHGPSKAETRVEGAHWDGEGPHVWVETEADIVLHRLDTGPEFL
jgi:hypothetical protein